MAESGAEGNRTPDLLDANETRYQLRYSPRPAGLPAVQEEPYQPLFAGRTRVGAVLEREVVVLVVDVDELRSRRQRRRRGGLEAG
jgi:hypothetical protein